MCSRTKQTDAVPRRSTSLLTLLASENDEILNWPNSPFHWTGSNASKLSGCQHNGNKVATFLPFQSAWIPAFLLLDGCDSARRKAKKASAGTDPFCRTSPRSLFRKQSRLWERWRWCWDVEMMLRCWKGRRSSLGDSNNVNILLVKKEHGLNGGHREINNFP